MSTLIKISSEEVNAVWVGRGVVVLTHPLYTVFPRTILIDHEGGFIRVVRLGLSLIREHAL